MGVVRKGVGIMLGFVDRSDEVVVRTTERIVKARTVHRMPAERRVMPGARKVSEVPSPAEVAEGEPVSVARIVSVPMVSVERRPAVPVVEPREYGARRF